jgi:hypothetical protein
MTTIRIKDEHGDIHEVTGEITLTDWIDNDGHQSSTAEIDGVLYRVIERDYYGPIYGKAQ